MSRSVRLATIASCTAVACSATPTDGERELAVVAGPAVAPDAELAESLWRYDAQALTERFEFELARLAERGEADLAELRDFGLCALHLAEIHKFRATTAGETEARSAAVDERLTVARRALWILEVGLEAHPDDDELLFHRGELLAYRIDGVVTGLRYGDDSERTLRRSATAGAELALAKRFFYLPGTFGGDWNRAADEIEVVLARHPEYEPAWGFLAQVEHARGDRAATVAACERALELNPHSLRGRFFLEHPDAGGATVTLLITGATGLLGCHLVERLAPTQKLRLVVRAGAASSARERLAGLLRGGALRSLANGHIEIVEGDLTDPALSLGADLEGVVHLAARTDFKSADVASYRPANVEAAARMAALAARAGCPLYYVSTAYVAGRIDRAFREDELDLGQVHDNAYERSKWEGERRVRALAAASDTPLVVLRPSVILPDRPRAGIPTGPGPLIYLELLSGLVGSAAKEVRVVRCEGDRGGVLDLVPLGLVVDALAKVAERPPTRTTTYHLTAGRAFSIEAIHTAVNACLEGLRVELRAPGDLADPDRFERVLARRTRSYAPYFTRRTTFDRTNFERDIGASSEVSARWLEEVFREHLRDWRAAAARATPASAPRPDTVDLLRYFEEFLPDKRGALLVPGLRTLTAEFTVSVPGVGTHRFQIDSGRLLEIGRAERPSDTFDYEVDAAAFLAVVRAQARPSELFFEQRVRVRGDLHRALATATALEDFFQLHPFDAADAPARHAS